MIVIGHDINYFYLGLGITHSQPFWNTIFVNVILLLFCTFSRHFLSFIAKGLAMCRLGGVISAQKVLFLTLFLIGFERFLCTNYYN